MDTMIKATLTQTFRRTPLAVLDNMPGQGAELTPAQLRSLAAALTKIADDTEARPMTAKHFMPARREYQLKEERAGT